MAALWTEKPSEGLLEKQRIHMGKRIREIRESKEMSIDELGNIFNPAVSSITICNWEKGVFAPSNENKDIIAKLGDISISQLERGTDDRELYFALEEIENVFYQYNANSNPNIDILRQIARLVTSDSVDVSKLGIIIDTLEDIIYESHHLGDRKHFADYQENPEKFISSFFVEICRQKEVAKKVINDAVEEIFQREITKLLSIVEDS
ncbi:helix-turn-helix domain-containing protein [Listeria newyorkensis]|uniref:Helix-turn-helix transcriptional regulator n=1 Tax=Listeria newyorkensis TaxID=1497681 RepID=A0A841YW56_9LIST|nr:helix-turn-helix transcriptional regulator [Listeria newyorkensis]MBC1457192.1 helix-turn-helix transcriptional regulator [Listeria newyorkensis]